MNTYIILSCLLAVLGLSQGNPIGAYGYGIPWHSVPVIAPAAVSTANVVRAAPIPVVRTHYAPVISTPIITPVVRTYGLGLGGYGGLGHGGHGGLGWGGYGLGYGGHGSWGGYGLGRH